MRGEKLFTITIAAILACSLSYENELKVRHPRAKGPPRPHSPDDRNEAPLPPPVDPEFLASCRMQKQIHRDIQCEQNGSFSEKQCKGRTCFCVNINTGQNINDQSFPMDEINSVNCSSAVACQNRACSSPRVCHGGYQLDENKCSTCECKALPTGERCTTIKDLVTDGDCTCPCIVESFIAADHASGPRACPSCNTDCPANTTDTSCAVMRQDQCQPGTSLKSVGPHARAECRPNLSRDEVCKPAPDQMPRPRRRKLAGLARREQRGELGDSPPPCGNNLTCKEVSLREYACVQENTTGICVQARRQDSYLRCDSDGSYLPLQCRPMPTNGTSILNVAPATHMRLESISHSMPHQCHCVQSDDGSMVAGTMKRVRSRSALPNCETEEKDCRVHRPGRRMLTVAHNEKYFDANMCRTCQCKNGNAKAVCSLRANCTVVHEQSENFTASNCALLNGTLIMNGKRGKVDCEYCSCRNGRLRCTNQKRCKKDGVIRAHEGNCSKCTKRPSRPVCGPGAHNHLSHCTATQCAGIPAVELQDGPCQSQDACEDYPCEGENEVCLNRKGTVSCIGRKGCITSQLRTCVNLTRISCPVVTTINEGSSDDSTGRDDVDSESTTEVCDADKQTYESICHFLQTSTNLDIFHAGACDVGECQARKVCSTTGITYDNMCELESQAADRIDYLGECLDSSLSIETKCKRVLDEKRCAINHTNCDVMVFTEDGCCPICGGAIQLVIDVDALSDASETNPEMGTIDFFTLSLMDVPIFDGLSKRCRVEVGLSTVENLLIVFKGLTNRDEEYCNEKIKEMESLVNDQQDAVSDGQRTRRQTTFSLPQVYDFVMTALAADEEESGTGGAVRLEAVAGMVALLLLITSGLIF